MTETPGERMKKQNTHVGSSFDDFLAEDGLLTETEAVALKRVIAFQIENEMTRAGLSKTELASRMDTSRSAVDRLLDPKNHAVTLRTLERAASVLGKRLKLELV
jgi:antitoxin HicB